VDLEDSFGLAGQVGVDIDINSWVFGVGVGYRF